VRVAASRAVDGAGSAGTAASAVGFPVALKAVGRARGAKVEASGVALDRHSAEAVAASYERMAAALGPRMRGAVVQAMVGPGLDVRVTLEPAPVVGAAIGLGIGGASDVPAPVALAALPLTDVAAADLVSRSGLGDRLGPEGTAAVIDVLHRVAELAEERPAVRRLELNPLIVDGGQATATDVVVELGEPRDSMPEHLRRLG
jgi:hypothetical protein